MGVRKESIPDIETKEQYQQYQKDVAAFIEREGLSFLSTGTDSVPEDDGGNVDPWFSGRPCECCGCTLGGNREYLFACNQANEIVQFEICEDCVYFVNYDTLYDSTMIRIVNKKS
jgi:hypothetical protein